MHWREYAHRVESHTLSKHFHTCCIVQFSQQLCKGGTWKYLLVLIFIFFNWKIIALQNFVVFYQTSTWIHISPPFWNSLPSPFPSHPSNLIQSPFFPFIFISWRLITLKYCSGFCHTLTWISHGFTCIPHSDPPSHLPLHLIPLRLPSVPGLSTCLMHPTWPQWSVSP